MQALQLILLGLVAPAWAQVPAPPVSPAPVVLYEYDAEGHPTKTVQAPGVSGFALPTTTSYDSLGRPKDTTNAKAGVTRFGFTGRDDLTQVTDPRNLVTQYPRNGLGQPTQLASPDTGTAALTYDAAGNLKTRTDARGVLTTYSYDALNRMTSAVHSLSGQVGTYTWTYDQTGSGYAHGVGRLTSSSHPNGSAQYSYNAQGRLVTAIQRVNATTGANTAQIASTVTYGYDAAGLLTSLTYPSGRKLVIGYTNAQPTSLSLAKDATSTPVAMLSQIQWEAFGPVRSWQWHMASGTVAHERVYDSSGRIVRYRLGGLLRDLRYDAAGRITSYRHLNTAGVAQPSYDQSFSYDELARLSGVTTASASWSFAYDANGNRTSATLNGASSAYTTAATSNRLLSTTTRTFSYDGAGNTTADTGNAYTATYTLDGRLKTITKAGVTTNYVYDAFGQRVRKHPSNAATSTVIFVYDQNGQLLGEYNASGQAIREYVWLGSTPVVVFTAGASATTNPYVFYLHTDHLDTPRIVNNTADQRRWRWLAEPFGTSAPETNPDGQGAFTMPLRFPGQYADLESGLNYNYFRDYNPALGRYVQSDPIGLAGGINTYAYVASVPTMYIDPNGLDPVGEAIGGVIGTWGGRIAGGAIGAATPVPGGAAIGSMAGGAIGKRVGSAVGSAVGDMCQPDQPDRCEKAKQEAQSKYWKLTTKRIPQYQSGGTRGSDPNHYKSIIELQSGLRDAIRRVRLYCIPPPPEVADWEQAANQYIPPQH